MNKYIALAAGIVLGLCFLLASVPVLLNLFTPPLPPEGTAGRHFMEGIGPTGYIKFVKIFEFVGALVVMVPRTRNIGLLLLGPVIVNIVAFHALVYAPDHLLNPMVIVIIVCTLFALGRAEEVLRPPELIPKKETHAHSPRPGCHRPDRPGRHRRAAGRICRFPRDGDLGAGG